MILWSVGAQILVKFHHVTNVHATCPPPPLLLHHHHHHHHHRHMVFSLTNATFRTIADNICLLLSPFISWHPLIRHPHYHLTTLVLVFLLFFFCLFSPEILSVWCYHWSAYSSLLSVIVTIFGFLYIIFSTPFVQILQPLRSFIGPNVFLSTFHSHVFRDDFICSVIVHISKPYGTTGLITVVYIFSFMCFEPAPLVHFNIFIFTFCKI